MPGPGAAEDPADSLTGTPGHRTRLADRKDRKDRNDRNDRKDRNDRNDRADQFPHDLARYIAASTGLPQPTAARVVADVATYFNETVEEFVCRRHAELRRRQYKNDEIWPQLAAELRQRRFAAPGLSERQLRRIAYERPGPASREPAGQTTDRAVKITSRGV